MKHVLGRHTSHYRLYMSMYSTVGTFHYWLGGSFLLSGYPVGVYGVNIFSLNLSGVKISAINYKVCEILFYLFCSLFLYYSGSPSNRVDNKRKRNTIVIFSENSICVACCATGGSLGFFIFAKLFLLILLTFSGSLSNF